jgi:hypothetical protein
MVVQPFRSLGQIIGGPVDLIEIDCIHLQPAQTGLAFASNGFRVQRVADLAFLVPDHPAFGENIRTLSSPIAQRFRDNFFGMAKPVDGCGVDPVNAKLQRLMNRRD